jgi:hypothetical protein
VGLQICRADGAPTAIHASVAAAMPYQRTDCFLELVSLEKVCVLCILVA